MVDEADLGAAVGAEGWAAAEEAEAGATAWEAGTAEWVEWEAAVRAVSGLAAGWGAMAASGWGALD